MGWHGIDRKQEPADSPSGCAGILRKLACEKFGVRRVANPITTLLAALIIRWEGSRDANMDISPTWTGTSIYTRISKRSNL